MVAFESLSHTYPGGVSISFKNGRVKRNEQYLILGQSGSGKTTLLHILCGLLKPVKGSVLVDGESVYSKSEPQRDLFRGRRIGIVFQRPHLLKSLNVLDNLLLAQSLAGYPNDKKRADDVLETLDLTEKKYSKISSLSEGQAQRVAIARAVMNKPGLLIADEPTSSLDDKNAEAVLDLLINQASANQSALIIATHDSRVKERIANQYHIG